MKALFLDRDGIVNVDHGYVYRTDDFEFVEGIFELVRLFFTNAGYLVFVVTNQSGIGRGYYREDDFQKLTSWMKEQFEEQGIHIEEVSTAPCTKRKRPLQKTKNRYDRSNNGNLRYRSALLLDDRRQTKRHRSCRKCRYRPQHCDRQYKD
ncbi:HAD-superfamily hydrolase [Sulfurovum sp. NBC37-1]|nr:HAD-superfamily hydrolase [Sulfurovum sp. NBC37-1]